MKQRIALRREAAGLYRGGPALRFTAKRVGRDRWRISDRQSGRKEHVRRLKDARVAFQFLLLVEPPRSTADPPPHRLREFF